jgi:probable phosphoglycerate mutase
MGTVLLARHGQTAWNRDGRVQGWAPTSLTDHGRDEARALAAHLGDRPIDRLLSSDLERAMETTRFLTRAVDADPTFERAWRERDFGRLQGLTREELFGGHPEFSLLTSGAAAAEARPESGESFLDVRDRVLGRWRDLRESVAGTDETVVVVAHGGPIYLLLGEIKGLDVVAAVADQDQDNCAVSELAVDDHGSVAVVRENDTSFI